MKRWSMQQIVDPNFRKSLENDFENLRGTVVLELADGNIRVSERMAFMNLFWWQILTAFNLPICKEDYIRHDAPLSMDVFTKRWGKYYDKIVAIDYHNAKRLKQVIWNVNDEIYRFCWNLLDYIGTIDILDMAEIMTDPSMKPILDDADKIVVPGAKPKSDKLKDLLDNKPWDTTKIETFIEEHRKKIMELFGTPGALKNEALLTYQRLGLLNEFQVPQTIFSFGPRTQLNDNLINYPVVGNALKGLNNIKEYMVERMAAAKSVAYNKDSVSDAQYNGRKLHLQASSIRNFYQGDCGSTAYVDYMITPEIAKNMYGKYVLDEVTGKLIILSESNIDSVIGKTVKMRSPMTCRYRYGVCEICGGKLLENVNRKVNPGMLSAIRFQEPVTQKILSAKHLVKTKSGTYVLIDDMVDHFELVRGSYIRIRKASQRMFKNCMIGIRVDDFAGINDIPLLRDNVEINERKLSCIRSFCVASKDKSHIWEYKTEEGKQTPFLTSEFLLHIRDHYDEVIQENGIIWIPLGDGVGLKIFKTIIVNDNMIDFVKSVNSFFGAGGTTTKTKDITTRNQIQPIKSFHTCSGALEALSELVYSKCKINIVHLEVILKSALITSKTDPNIPVVTDPNNVMFGTIEHILSRRHVGNKLLYEGLNRYIKDSPETYTVPKAPSVFDTLVGFKSAD